MEAKQLFADFFDEDALREPFYRLHRIDGHKDRWYYRLDTDRFYRSVTTVIQANTPTPYGILEWIKQNGQESDAMRDERAAYGTFLHKQIGKLLIDGQYDLDSLRSLAELDSVGVTGATASTWYADAVQDILAFEAFRREHSVVPLAIEVSLCSDKGYAGSIDLVCRMTVRVDGLDHDNPYKSGARKGQPREVKIDKEIVAIVDFKSGRKGFYESHEIQLHMYRDMWNENFPSLPVDNVFNWSPKDWRTAPGFNLKDQTDSKNAALIPDILSMDAKRTSGEPPARLVAEGIITSDKPLDEVYAFRSVRDEVKERVAS